MKIAINFISKNRWAVIFVLSLIATTIIKFLSVGGNNFPFTIDQGRDMVDIRHMVVTFTPRLVGPTTSINGVLLGPFWYYFNLPAFILGGGDPAVIVYWQIIWYQISAFALWWVIKKKNISLASIITLFYLFMPTGFNTARYFWNANSMPFFTCFYFVILIYTTQKTTNKNLLLLGLFAGLAMQIEAAFGIVLFPFAFLYFLLQKIDFKKLISLCIGFGITIIPQALFELRHGFTMTKLLIGEFTGKGEMLGDKITFGERATQRWEHLQDLLRHSNHIPENYVFIIFAIALITFLFLQSKKISDIKELGVWSLSSWFMLFTATFYLLFPQKLKIWYTLGFSVPLIVFLGSFIYFLSKRKNVFLRISALTIILFTVIYSFKAQFQYINEAPAMAANNKSSLSSELQAIDWIYQNSNGLGFKVYSYLPSIYDFPYNHLFWSYGNKKFGYQPWETAYLPNQPEYIRDVDKLWKNKKPLGEDNLTFLIIESDSEMPVRVQEWLGNFSGLCQIKDTAFPWGTTVKMMAACKK